MVGTVFLNRRFVAAARARVSVFDRGLLYGDGLFETLRVYRGEVFALDTHLARLRASAVFLGIPLPRLDWTEIIGALVQRNRLMVRDASVRITLTRGPASPGLVPPRRPHPTVLIVAAPLAGNIARAQRRGVRVTLLPLARAADVLAGHKLLNYVPAILGRIAAASRNAFEALYVDERKQLSEGTTSNLFIVRDGHLFTPPAPRGVLPGITRRLVIDLARHERMPVHERTLRVPDLLAASEAFCTSSLIEIVPIVRVDDGAIATATPGPITRLLQRRYRAMVARS
ncbi:MAG TPA: aminotransferase class IV [Candidatus Binatia bacterium]|nr:aminotransferase class IV [Candidatus Binatia bacterium]